MQPFNRIERAATLAEAAYRVKRAEGASRLFAFRVALKLGRAALGR